MKFKVKWCIEKDSQHLPHYICDGCNEVMDEIFMIDNDKGRGDDLILWMLCSDCMEALQAVISPLSILVQTGKDTKRINDG
jgi:hypothetical protein